MADLSAITLNDAAGLPVVLHNGTTRGVTQVTGIAGITAPRRSVRPRPTAHGTIDETRWTDEAIITIEAYVRGTSDAAAFNELRLVTAPMLATLEAPALLKWTESDGGLSLQRTVKLSGPVDAPLKADGMSLLRYQVALAAADPRAYSQTLTTAVGTALSVLGGGLTFPATMNFTFAASGGGTVSFTNTGNRPAPVIFRLQGGWTNASIVNLGTGARINLVGSISGSDYLDVNTFDRTILLNGMSSRSNFYDAATSQWADVPPGTSNFQMTAASFDGTAAPTITGRSAYA